MTNNVQPPPGAAHAPVTPGTPPATLPDLPVCGGPASIQVELYSPVDGRAHGRLEGTVSVCTGDVDYLRATVIAAGLTPYVLAGGDEIRRCGEGSDLSNPVRLVMLTPPDIAAGPVARPVAVPQPATRRIARANMMRALSRLSYAVGRLALPAPVMLRFMDESGSDQVVIVRFEAIAEAEEWATHFDVMRGAQIIDTISEAGHQVRVFSAWAQWRGFSLVLSAVVPPEGDPVPAVVRPTAPISGAAVGALR
ncbi:hypothetical protein ACIA59_17375 [Micromonospora haikouensis]|uniref:hypothetical protein n=1 Tax=Micromonospora haikouensis TaxID=686309 RepID=UPI0037BA39F8